MPAGRSARQLSVPKRLTSLVSWISETRLPDGGVAGGKPNDRARDRRFPASRVPSGSARSDENLSGIELGDRRGLVAVVADLEELAFGAGADDQAVVDPGERVDQRLEPEDFTRNSVGVETVDGVVARR